MSIEPWQAVLTLIGGFSVLMLVAMVVARAFFGKYEDDEDI